MTRPWSAPLFQSPPDAERYEDLLSINCQLVTDWLVAFLRDEMQNHRNVGRCVIGLSGGVDSAVTTYLCARAFGPDNVYAIRMPYRTSSAESLAHAQLIVDDLGIHCDTIEITDAVDGYCQFVPDMDGRRKGNVMARIRMVVLFDQAERHRALPVGTGNKTERLFGYYTWHADDSPPINPLGDLFKSQVWSLARYLGVPDAIVNKPPTADLVAGQTDEGDLGVSYRQADAILALLLQGYSVERLCAIGHDAQSVAIVQRRVASTHWKRHLPTTAMLSNTSINDFYRRPVDY